MAAKFFFVFCASLALVNTIAARSCAQQWPCGVPAMASAWPSATIGGCGGVGFNGVTGYNAVAVDNGGCLDVTSASALAPNGVTIVCDNEISGALEVVGAAPVLAAVAFEGNVPSAGSAGTSYSCGNGNIGISAESLAAAGLGAGAGLAGYGLGANAALANAAGANAALANAAFGNAAFANAGRVNAGFANAGRLIAPGAGCGCGGIYY